jgi:hypothetical protein
MKRVALVAAHFTPSNLAAVHRARLWAQHLPEFGWEPIVVTAHHRHYEEALDWELHQLVPSSLRVVRTSAIPTKPLRLIGDIGVRALPFHFAALAGLCARREIDFVHVTIPSNFSAVLGRMVHARYGVPYGIDYIDPWVHEWPGSERRFSKAWTSARLAELLEPWAVRDAALITGVAPGYYEAVLERNPALAERVVTAAMPYGGSERDFDAVRGDPRAPSLFDPGDGAFHMVYAGALLPRAFTVLERLLAGITLLRTRQPALAARLRLHFIGSGKSPSDPHGYNVLPLVERHGLGAIVSEHPARIPYTDVLRHLTAASAILILGSTEAHYTPSKAFQAVMARRPVLALLHRASTAAEFLQRANAARVVALDEHELPAAAQIAAELASLIEGDGAPPPDVRWELLEPYSARSGTRVLAAALDQALARDRDQPGSA